MTGSAAYGRTVAPQSVPRPPAVELAATAPNRGGAPPDAIGVGMVGYQAQLKDRLDQSA